MFETFRTKFDGVPAEIQRKRVLIERLLNSIISGSSTRDSLYTDLLSRVSADSQFSDPSFDITAPFFDVINKYIESLTTAHEATEISSQVLKSLEEQLLALDDLIQNHESDHLKPQQTDSTSPFVLDISADGHFCHCRSSVPGPIISCSNCGDFNHNACAGLPPDYTGHFLCSKCLASPKDQLLDFPHFDF
ncbi:hypothetical protein RCL1_002511 [Eukaryota sp. TZLM3-RCL]